MAYAMFNAIEEAKKTIIGLLWNMGGKATSAMFKGIPYKNPAIEELISQKKLEQTQEGLVLTELGKEEAQKLLSNSATPLPSVSKIERVKQLTIQNNLSKKIFVENAIGKLRQILSTHDGVLCWKDCYEYFTKNERNAIFQNYHYTCVPSRTLDEDEKNWFFEGDEKVALRKIRKIVKKTVLARWIEFAKTFTETFGIQLNIDTKNPKLTAAAIKKAIALHTATIKKIAQDSGISLTVMERACQSLQIPYLVTPEGYTIFSLRVISDKLCQITGYYTVTTAHIASYLGVTRETVRRKIRKANISPHSRPYYASYTYLWKNVKCLFPNPAPDVREVLLQFQSTKEKLLEEERKRKEEAEKKAQEKIQKEREKLLVLKDQLLAMFPVKTREVCPKIVFHVGPTNSGKTHYALEALQKADNGIYLAPLRLLAWEVYEKLNKNNLPCSLVTGEEIILQEDADFIAATVEMLPDQTFWHTVVLDEAQMATDEERGWAWTRVLNSVSTDELHICCAPEAEKLLRNFTAKLGYTEIEVKKYERLCPLRVAKQPWSVENPQEETIFVVFRRIDALALKNFFEEMEIPASVIYGALPPDVRRKQADRFISGKSKVCVATDAIGMGMNLPARYVCFTTLEKFDGHITRTLKPLELRQIAGRAGRFGLQDFGEVGATSKKLLDEVRKMLDAPSSFPSHVRIAPTLLELEILTGSLANRLMLWLEMKAIPEDYLKFIEPCNLTTQVKLASLIPKQWEDKLGLQKCLTLVSAPVTEESEEYWGQCLSQIVKEEPLSAPAIPEDFGEPDSDTLEMLEIYVKEAELLLWLGNRHELRGCVSPEDKDAVLAQKRLVSGHIDTILQKKIGGKVKTCRMCGKALPPLYPYGLCERCYSSSRRDKLYFSDYEEEEYDDDDEYF